MREYPFSGKKLMSPGPVPLPDYVRESLQKYECHHRTDEFGEVLIRVFQNLKRIFKTEKHGYLLSATGTGALEAAMINTLDPEKPCLFINAGKFGERWSKIASAYGMSFDEMKVPWGRDVDLEWLEDFFKKKKYQAVAFQACETSTGALLPTQEIAMLAQKYNVMTLVDGITALGATELPMDEWGLDVVVGGSQKAFMLPAGMAFLALSDRAEKVENKIPKFYFDLAAEKTANMLGKTRWSTPTHFVIALDLVLENILNQVGFDKHLQTIKDNAEYFRKTVHLELFPKTPSPSLTCLKMPKERGGNNLKEALSIQGLIVAGGQDQLKDKVIRVGHMGDISKEDLKRTAGVINQLL